MPLLDISHAQHDNIVAINSGEFTWELSDSVLVYASDGSGLFTISSDFTTLVGYIFTTTVIGTPVVVGDFVVFASTSGNLQDLTYSPSDATKTKVVMANGAVTSGSLAVYKDTAGTVGAPGATTTLGGNLAVAGYNIHSNANALTAFAGGGQGSALQLAKEINRVTTVATAGDSVKLPVSVAGMQVTVINAAASNAMDTFPATGEVINALSANTALSLTANSTVIFSCAVAGTWNTVVTA